MVPAVVSSLGCTAVGASECSAPPGGRARSILARPKSRIFAWPRAGDEDVGGLEVAVDDPLRVRRLERVRDLDAELEQLADLERPPADPLGQRLALEQLHRDEVAALVLVDRVHRADAGVVERRGGLRLPLEALERGGVLRQLCRQELERDVPAELRVFRLVHDTHAAAAQLRRDPVVRDDLADHRLMAPSPGLLTLRPHRAGTAARTPARRGGS